MALTKVGSVGIATGVSLTGITTTQDAKVGTGITLSPDGHGYYTGIVTATSYRGDVSNCTGVGQTNFIDAESINCSGITTVGTGITLSPDGNIYATGVVTATSYAGDGSALTGIAATDNVRTGILDVAGVGTFRDNVNVADRIIHVGDTNCSIRFPAADTFTVETNGTERVRVDSGGRLLIATTDIDSVSDGEVSKLIVKGTSSDASGTFVRHSADAGGTGIYIGKSRNATVGSNTIVQDGDELGRITFSGDDGTNINTVAASIRAYVDGTPGENDMPGRLIFSTTADGNAGVSERMRIDSSGRLLLGTTTTGFAAYGDALTIENSNHVGLTLRTATNKDAAIYFADSSSGSGRYAGAINYNHSNNYLNFTVNTAERLRIDSNGNTNITGVCTAAAFSPTSGQISNRNLIQNGAFNVAQRGTSSGSSGFKCVDRWRMSASGASAALTQSQTALTSGSPYDEGFRNCFKILNAGQSGNNQGYAYMIHTMEAQDIANSGWQYTSASSYVTLSFWIKVNVAQTYLMFFHTNDTSTKEYNMLLNLPANTWTKVTKVIPGHADIVINNDTGNGFQLILCGYLGDYFTSGSTTESWVTHSGYVSRPDMGSTWWTQSNATLEITGVQLEVGQHATPFEHRTYADDLRICQRFFWKIDDGNYRRINGYKRHDNNCHFEIQSPVPMRVAPSPTLTDGGLFTNFQSTYSATQSSPTVGEWNLATGQGLLQCQSTWSSTHAIIPSWESYALEMSAEL